MIKAGWITNVDILVLKLFQDTLDFCNPLLFFHLVHSDNLIWIFKWVTFMYGSENKQIGLIIIKQSVPIDSFNIFCF